MSRSHLINTFAQLIVAIAFLNTPVSGQSVSSAVAVPDTEGSGAGRPTLKQRQPDSRNASSPSASQQPPKEDCCSPEASQTMTNELSVRFEGLHAFTSAEMLKRIRETRVSLPKDHILTPEVLAAAATVLKESLEAHGYMLASVEARQDQGANTIVLLVSEGPRFSIGEIRFERNRIFSSEELAERIWELLQRFENSKNGYNAEIFDYCLRQLTDSLRSKGYLQARLGEPKKEFTDGRLVVTVPVEEGSLYRLGEIKIGGAESLTEQQVRDMLSLHLGEIANGEAIGKWLFEDLKKLYGEMGYIQYTAEPKPDFRAVDPATNEGVVDLRVTIEEGQRFKIRSIKFEGDYVSERELRNLLLIHAGDVYNQELLETSVNRLNEMGWVIDKDKDTYFKTDEEEALLDITFRLKRPETLHATFR